MIEVNPANMATAASSLCGALTAVAHGHPVHPPLAADPVAVGCSARLSSGATTLAMQVGALTVGLAYTSVWFEQVGVGMDIVNEEAAARLRTLAPGTAVGPIAVTPVLPTTSVPDVRPPLASVGPVPGSIVSRALHQGDPDAGEGFSASWTTVGYALDEAADTVKTVIDGLPEAYDSDRVTPALLTHLSSYRSALQEAGRRAHGLSEQAQQHRSDVMQALQDIPTPKQYDDNAQQLRNAVQINTRTGGLHTPAVLRLTGQRQELETQGGQGYLKFQTISHLTTEGDPAAPTGEVPPVGDGPGLEQEVVASLGPEGVPLGPDGLPLDLDEFTDQSEAPMGMGELGSLLPSLIPSILGGVGGVLGGVFSTVSSGPETLLQAAGQAAQMAAQTISGVAGDSGDLDLDETAGLGEGGLGGFAPGSGTSPAGGPDAPVLPPAVSPSGPVAAPTIPAGVRPAAAAVSSGAPMGGGMMPMSPMGMMPGGGPGGEQKKAEGKPRGVAMPEVPHSEAVTGKVTEDRIVASSISSESDPPEDGGSGSGARRPMVRKVSLAPIGRGEQP